MEKEQLIDGLNDLLQLEHDAVRAYQTCIDNCDGDDLKMNLGRFLSDHERHLGWLSERVRSEGGKPKDRPDLKGPFIKGLTAIMSRMGDMNALRIMHQNENLTNSAYDSALEKVFPTDIQAKLLEFQGDERRHREWIVQALEDMKSGTEAPRPSPEQRPGSQP